MDYSAIGQAAAASEDLTVERKTTRELPREGIALLRLVDYIETGRHEAKNPKHKPSLKVLLSFELSHPDHMVEVDGKKVPQKITVRVNKTYSDKGKYIPLFKAMTRCFPNEQINHFVQMINKPLLGRIYHTEWEGKKYANLDVDGAWSFMEAVQEDALSGAKTPVPVPEMHNEPKVFLWEPEGCTDDQIKGMWESIFIEGVRTDDKGKEVSKNWIQETVMANIEWEGSVTQALTQEHISLDDEEVTDEESQPSLDD